MHKSAQGYQGYRSATAQGYRRVLFQGRYRARQFNEPRDNHILPELDRAAAKLFFFYFSNFSFYFFKTKKSTQWSSGRIRLSPGTLADRALQSYGGRGGGNFMARLTNLVAPNSPDYGRPPL